MVCCKVTTNKIAFAMVFKRNGWQHSWCYQTLYMFSYSQLYCMKCLSSQLCCHGYRQGGAAQVPSAAGCDWAWCHLLAAHHRASHGPDQSPRVCTLVGLVHFGLSPFVVFMLRLLPVLVVAHGKLLSFSVCYFYVVVTCFCCCSW